MSRFRYEVDFSPNKLESYIQTTGLNLVSFDTLPETHSQFALEK